MRHYKLAARTAALAMLALAAACDDGPSARDGQTQNGVALPPEAVDTDTTPQSGTGGTIPGNDPELIEGRQNVAEPE